MLDGYSWTDDEVLVVLYVELSRPVKSNELTVALGARTLEVVDVRDLGGVTAAHQHRREVGRELARAGSLGSVDRDGDPTLGVVGQDLGGKRLQRALAGGRPSRHDPSVATAS